MSWDASILAIQVESIFYFLVHKNDSSKHGRPIKDVKII